MFVFKNDFICQNINYCRETDFNIILHFPGFPSKHFVIKGTKPAHLFPSHELLSRDSGSRKRHCLFDFKPCSQSLFDNKLLSLR